MHRHGTLRVRDVPDEVLGEVPDVGPGAERLFVAAVALTAACCDGNTISDLTASWGARRILLTGVPRFWLWSSIRVCGLMKRAGCDGGSAASAAGVARASLRVKKSRANRCTRSSRVTPSTTRTTASSACHSLRRTGLTHTPTSYSRGPSSHSCAYRPHSDHHRNALP